MLKGRLEHKEDHKKCFIDDLHQTKQVDARACTIINGFFFIYITERHIVIATYTHNFLSIHLNIVFANYSQVLVHALGFFLIRRYSIVCINILSLKENYLTL